MEYIDIGVDGSLVEHYPFFRDMIYEALRVVDGIGAQGAEKIRIGIAKDGSGVGAALIALVAAGMEKEGDLIADLREDVKRELHSIRNGKSTCCRICSGEGSELEQVSGSRLTRPATEEMSTTQQIALGAGFVGIAAILGLWWARRQNLA